MNGFHHYLFGDSVMDCLKIIFVQRVIILLEARFWSSLLSNWPSNWCDKCLG